MGKWESATIARFCSVISYGHKNTKNHTKFGTVVAVFVAISFISSLSLAEFWVLRKMALHGDYADDTCDFVSGGELADAGLHEPLFGDCQYHS